MNEENFMKLRYCFQGGYTLPQYCIDNGIKKPLFVLEKKASLFLKEIYVQFQYDKRLLAEFCFIDGDENGNIVPRDGVLISLNIRRFSSMNLNAFDKIILLTKEKIDLADEKVIPFADLEIFCYRQSHANIPLLNFLQRYPQVKLFLTNFGTITLYEGWKEVDEKLWNFTDLGHAIRNAGDKSIETPLDKFGYTNAQVLELIFPSRAKRNADGTTSLIEDDNYPLRGIKNGKRMTAYQPEHFQNRIYFFGPCHFYGVDAPYDKTIESYLQKMLNENNLPYRVENESQGFAGRWQDLFYNLNALDPKPNDIIFINAFGMHSNNDVIPYCDVSDAFAPPNDYREVCCTKSHVNELGYKLVAEKYFKFLTENNFFVDKEFKYPPPPTAYFHRYGIPPQFEAGSLTSVSEELDNYKQSLRAKRLPVGAIVMNCNPFTLGHQYLVEYAAAKVVKLYIFVVEEDKSEFPFADRIELVKQGVKHIPNVEVLPSGKFIISQTTFSGYFSKAELQNVQVDSSEDVEIFGREIAPTLGITVRFAGEEPKDNVTRQYNETMKRILPRYGVEFHEITRKALGDEVISASSVRAALKRDDFDKVKSLVPASTFEYLLGKKNVFSRYRTAWISIKLMAEEDFQIFNVSDDKATIIKPVWLQRIQGNGVGYAIKSCGDKLEFVAKASVDGQIRLVLRGLDVPNPADKSKLIPYWIDYTKLVVNGKVVFDTITPAWFYKAYSYTLDAKAGEEVTVQVEWQPHDN